MEHAKGLQLHNIAIQDASSVSKSKTLWFEYTSIQEHCNLRCVYHNSGKQNVHFIAKENLITKLFWKFTNCVHHIWSKTPI